MDKPDDLHLTLDQWRIVRSVLERCVPESEVWAFGSRVQEGPTKPYSDLDLAVVREGGLSLQEIAFLEDEFSESELPFRVDILDLARSNEAFQAIVGRRHIVVQSANDQRGA